MPNFLELRGLKSQDITHDAQLIKAVPVDDTEKAADRVLAYDQPHDKLAYVPKCPEIVIKAIQHISISIPNGDLSAQVLINEVDMDNTFLVYGGADCNNQYPWLGQARLELTDSTHVTATRGATTGALLILSVSIIQCTAGIKSIQRGTITNELNTYEDATILPVDTDKTFLSYLSFSSTVNLWAKSLTRLTLLNSTTVRATVSVIPGSGTYVIVSYEVIEFI